jgi:hypothetical protein
MYQVETIGRGVKFSASKAHFPVLAVSKSMALRCLVGPYSGVLKASATEM